MSKFVKNKINIDDKHPDKKIINQIIRTLTTSRDESGATNDLSVIQDVDKVGLVNSKTKEDVKTIFYTQNFPHIRSIAAIYLQHTDHHIQEKISKTFTHNTEIFNNIINFAQNPTNYFAKCLVTAFMEPCFDKYIVNLVLILRCEVDMIDIKEEYFKMTGGETLKESIVRECSGSYRSALLELIGERADSLNKHFSPKILT